LEGQDTAGGPQIGGPNKKVPSETIMGWGQTGDFRGCKLNNGMMAPKKKNRAKKVFTMENHKVVGHPGKGYEKLEAILHRR